MLPKKLSCHKGSGSEALGLGVCERIMICEPGCSSWQKSACACEHKSVRFTGAGASTGEEMAVNP